MEKISFVDFKEKTFEKEGIVLLGAGGDLNEWVDGISDMLYNTGVTKENANYLFPERYVLQTSGGRTDLVLVIDFNKVDSGKLAMWRIRFGECSWISDYYVNYAKDHGVASEHVVAFGDEDED